MEKLIRFNGVYNVQTDRTITTLFFNESNLKEVSTVDGKIHILTNNGDKYIAKSAHEQKEDNR